MKILIAFCVFLYCPLAAVAGLIIDEKPLTGSDVPLFDSQSAANIYVDSRDAQVVQIAAGLLADDVERVSRLRPKIQNQSSNLDSTAILIGTLGQSPVIDQLIANGKIDCAKIKGQWESFLWQTVNDPFPGVHRALVIAGSDRRGTAYGVVELSKRIGVSAWYWWADVPPTRHAQLRISAGEEITASPGIKYRGIFINDEDWGLRPWATQTLDPQTGKIGPKTYGKIFELMLRLRLNYLWPAMHPGPGSSEFSTFPGNAELADRWAIVTGSSHCEPMLRNNIFWPKESGPWQYDLNRNAIFNYWKESATHNGNFESIWTLGIRGIHDLPMQGPTDPHARVQMVEQTITDQRSLIDPFVTKKYGPPAECFVPYKEVLPLYDMGMKVPDDVTFVWPDDNYGYVRRLGTPAERKRSGGSGVYYHLSYWGQPHSYLWVESAAPALMWEELRKAYDNDSRTIWIVNVGDIKPAEVAIDFFSRLAWQPGDWGPNSQQKFLNAFDTEIFAPEAARIHELQDVYYKLAAVRKPEHISCAWLDSLSPSQRSALSQRYRALLTAEQLSAQAIPADLADACFEMIGYPARMLAATGLLYCGDEAQAKKWKQYIDQQTDQYNNKTAHGKWRGMMSNTMEGLAWPASVGGTAKPVARATTLPADQTLHTIDAAQYTRIRSPSSVCWQTVAGLGWSGRAVTPFPAVAISDRDPLSNAPVLEYDFSVNDSRAGTIFLHALPTLRLTPEGHLRLAAAIDNNAPVTFDIPGGASDNELGKDRREGVLANRVTVNIPIGNLPEAIHTLKIYAIDPGVILDQIEFPR